MTRSPFFSLIIDESDDVALKKKLCICIRYIVDAIPRTSFVAFVELPNGQASTIINAVEKEVEKCKLDWSRLVGFASDGCSVMTGAHQGVAAKLKEKAPCMVATHCLAHRLALAAEGPLHDPAHKDMLTYLDTHFFVTLKQLYSYFDHSSVRTARMVDVCDKLNMAHKKIVLPSFTRWLSHDAVVRCIKELLPALISLFKEDDQRHDNHYAHGLLRCVTEYYFIASLLMFTEVLPSFARLSRIFQTASLDFSILDGEIRTLTDILMTLQKVSQILNLT